ncbi:MAG: RsmB/NOP family class I SAM-dependent RNA methyltransferase [Chlamydia sp.]|nr:RsmB/NOP family class I SAM-dependent RNA methyltransferase [Chlamydia sp.]
MLEEKKEVSPQTLVEKVEEGVTEDVEQFQRFPWAVRYSLSDDLAECLSTDYGEEEALRLAKIFLEEAPCSIRVNTRRISLDKLQEILPFPCHKGAAPSSLRFDKRYPLQHTRAFRRGLFEIQDESSQIITNAILIKDSDTILDFCAGAGGKSLIFAQRARHVTLHDSRPQILEEARQRLCRSGIKNFTIHSSGSIKKQAFSLVVVDAPCTGSGVFRRHPEKKLLFSKKLLLNNAAAQEKILKEAQTYVAPHGRLVYITCSLLKEENEKHISRMMSLGWKCVKEVKIPLISQQGDAFFSVHFIRSRDL